MASALQILTAMGVFTLLSILVVLAYHHLYRASLTVVGKVELEWVAPATVPGLMLAWWLLGIFDSVIYVGVFPDDIWTLWVPAGALLVFGFSRPFAVWNLARLTKKLQRHQ